MDREQFEYHQAKAEVVEERTEEKAAKLGELLDAKREAAELGSVDPTTLGHDPAASQGQEQEELL